MALNALVDMWLSERKLEGLPSLMEVGYFVVVDETLFDEYDSFTKKFKAMKSFKTFLPNCPLLVLFLQKNAFPIESVLGGRYLKFHPLAVDEAYQWVTDLRSRFFSEGAKVFDSI